MLTSWFNSPSLWNLFFKANESEAPLKSLKSNEEDIEGRLRVYSFSKILFEFIFNLRFLLLDIVLFTEFKVLDICFGILTRLLSDNYNSKPKVLWKYSL